mgnify:CR=1 FL=1
MAEAVERLARGHYENFGVLTPLTAGWLRRDFATVYAFCRGVDDAGDRVGVSAEDRLEELSRWRAAVRGVWAGEGAEAAREVGVAGLWDRLEELVVRRGLRVEPFEDLIGAFERDQRQGVYETWDDLLSYCAKSADPVGRIVLALGGVDERDPAEAEVVRMSDLVCTGLQLANMWQDVRRDLLDLGRVYLPVAETGLGPEELREMAERGGDASARVRFIRAMRPMVDRTRDEFFGPSLGLSGLLRERGGGAAGLAGPVWLFRGGGVAALEAVERVGCATLWGRPRVGLLRRARLLVGAWVRFGLR